MTERDFTKQVIKTAQAFGWWAVHFPTTTGSGRTGEFRTSYLGNGKGFPDIVAIKGSRLLFAELKIPPNKPTVEQVAWGQALTVAGAETYLWTPGDLEEIDRVLSGR